VHHLLEQALGHNDEHVQTSLRLNANDRQEFLNQANARMLRSIDSQANFVMLGSEHPMGVTIEKVPIETIVEHFASHEIILPRAFVPLEPYVRVSLGTPAEMRQFWRVWDLMAGHRMQVGPHQRPRRGASRWSECRAFDSGELSRQTDESAMMPFSDHSCTGRAVARTRA
jgi:hypothetical protein